MYSKKYNRIIEYLLRDVMYVCVLFSTNQNY